MSQGANKLVGICGVCRGEFRLQKSGILYAHGERRGRCAGSNQPPLSGGNLTAPIMLDPAGLPDGNVLLTQAGTAGSGALNSAHGQTRTGPVRLMDHIPRGARAACSSLLTSILNSICQNPSLPDPWQSLLIFGRAILSKPARGGRRANVAGLVKKKVSAFEQDNTVLPPPAYNGNKNPSKSRDGILAAAVAAKLEAGNVRAAVRLLCSEEEPAADCEATFDALLAKHPRAPEDRREFPGKEDASLLIGNNDVMTAIRSFPSGSSGGIDGFTPQHLKDLVGEAGSESPSVVALTGFVNTLLRGDCPEVIIPILFGGRLLALAKKDGGFRPIAVGSVWRRLASKCASTYAIRTTRDLLAPRQVGVGVPGGAESSVHASRRFIDRLKTNQFFFQIRFLKCIQHFEKRLHVGGS